MKRIVLWLLGTITVVTLLFGYRTSTEGALQSSEQNVVSSTPDTTSSGSTSSGSSSSSSGSSSSSSSSASKTVKGSVVQTRWGPVQVQVTVENGKITKVTVPVYPNENHKDQEINAYALPILIDETVTAQSADIDMVSGATITSQGYVESLQAALDEAGL